MYINHKYNFNKNSYTGSVQWHGNRWFYHEDFQFLIEIDQVHGVQFIEVFIKFCFIHAVTICTFKNISKDLISAHPRWLRRCYVLWNAMWSTISKYSYSLKPNMRERERERERENKSYSQENFLAKVSGKSNPRVSTSRPLSTGFVVQPLQSIFLYLLFEWMLFIPYEPLAAF